jgi:hypothetical protein
VASPTSAEIRRYARRCCATTARASTRNASAFGALALGDIKAIEIVDDVARVGPPRPR